MIGIILSLAVALQLAGQRETPPLSLQIYPQGPQIGAEPVSVIMEVTNRSDHSVTLLKSPVFPVFKSEIGPSSRPAANKEQIYRLLLVYDSTPPAEPHIVQAEGGTAVPFQHLTLAPGEIAYAKTTLSRYMVGQRAKVWLEIREGETASRSNRLEFESTPAK